ncbi:MAG: glycosyltransferase family 4 protein [Fibrobacteria bacterium]|nr:glycosyltransferase family 4 protein [Fibrobacteria bacterium]
MSSIRLLWLNWRDLRNPLAGGAEVHAHEVLARLADRGWDCTLVSHAVRGLPSSDREAGYSVRREGGGNTFNFTVWNRLPEWVAELRPEIVVDDSNKIPLLAPWRTSVPVVGLIHHLFGTTIFREASPPAALYVHLAERLVPRCYRSVPVMTGSPSAQAELLRLGLQRVVDVGEGVDLRGYAPPGPGERDPDMLLYLGRVKKYKGLDVLLHTLAALVPHHPRVRLEIAGSGDDVPRLRAVAQTLGIAERVHFHGRVSEDEKISLYRRASVALNSSRKEGWGLTSIEANGCGTPVVASDVPGLCDSVRDGQTGYLVPFGDHAAMAERVGRILADGSLAKFLQERSLSWAAEHTWDRVAERTEEVLRRRLASR